MTPQPHLAPALPADVSGTHPEAAWRLPESAASARLLVQRTFFAGPSDLVSTDMYVRADRGELSATRQQVTVAPSAEVTTDTYFGRFPASYWQRWTDATAVAVELLATGSGTVRVAASDWHGQRRIVHAVDVVGDTAHRVTLRADIDRFFDGGALWLEFATDTDQQLAVEGVRWTVDAPQRFRPTAVAICTMNRADDCLANLIALADDEDCRAVCERVYVADQGTDTVDLRSGFAEIAARLGGTLRYIRQANLGGAGGFTRGLYEALDAEPGQAPNVLFTDDDVLLEPDMIVRLTAFANRTTEPMIVGGQMLNLLHPDQLHVSAEYARLNTLEPGVVVPHGLDTADVAGVSGGREPHRQERRVDAGYNGWWACLLPPEVVAAIGYPLPMFFQWDDIEFSYRARANGFAVVTLPGAGVWHADFGWKDWDEWHRYFNLRNSIITAALHSSFDLTQLTRVLAAQLVRYLLSMQYGLAATLLKAVEDFLAGPDVLHDGGVSAMAEIKQLRARYPETRAVRATHVDGLTSSEIGIVNAAPRPSMDRAVLLKRTLYRLIGKHVYDLGQIPADEAHWWHVSLFRTAVVTDASQQGVRVRTYDRAQMFRLAKQAGRVLARLNRDGRRVRDDYRRALPQLASRANWQRLFAG